MTRQHVYAAISAVTNALAKRGVGKQHVNEEEGYRFRSVDDVMAALAPLLARHKLCVLPRVQDVACAERRDQRGGILRQATVRVQYELISAKDGSSHIVEACGEALDASDKATSKAMSAAYKYAMIQAFCIPVEGAADADRHSRRTLPIAHEVEPVQGWDQWLVDISDVAKGCETTDALSRLRETNRSLLIGLSRERPDLYRQLGAAFSKKRLSFSPHVERVPPGGGKRSAQDKSAATAARARKEPAEAAAC
jgi:hypothetical protein